MGTKRTGQTVYLIKRGPKPAHHVAPYHGIIVCDRKGVAAWEAGCTGDGATVWTHESGSVSGGWLLVRWNGLDVDYGHVVRSFTLPDGTKAAFAHSKDEEPWTLIKSASWWSMAPMPHWLASFGCRPVDDEFSTEAIMGDYEYSYRKR